MADPRDAAAPAQEVTNEEVAWRQTGPIVRTDPLIIDEGKLLVIDGDLSIGTSGTPLTTDQTHLDIKEGGRLVVLGNLEIHRNVSSATALTHIRNGSLYVGGTFNTEDSGGGAGYTVWMDGGGALNVKGASTLTTDATSGSWTACIYAISGASTMVWTGGLTVSCTGAGIMPIWIDGCDCYVGDYEAYSGNLVVTATATDLLEYGVVTCSRGKLVVVRDVTITANSVATGGGGLVIRHATYQSIGTLSVSMSSKTDGKLIWCMHKCHASQYQMGTLTPAASPSAASIRVEENGHFECQSTCDLTGNGGTIEVIQQSTCYFNAPKFGTSGSPVTADLPCISMEDTSEMYTEGAVECHRNKSSATTYQLRISGASRVNIDGALTTVHTGGGTTDTILFTLGSEVQVKGDVSITTDLSASGQNALAIFYGARFHVSKFTGSANLAVIATGAAVIGIGTFGVGSELLVRDGTTTVTVNNSTAYLSGILADGGSRINLNTGTVTVQGTSATGRAIGSWAGSQFLLRTCDVVINYPASDDAVSVWTGGRIDQTSGSKTTSITLQATGAIGGNAIYATGGGVLNCAGTVDLIAYGDGSASVSDGTVVLADHGSRVNIKGLKLNSGGDLDLGDAAMLHATSGSKLHVTGTTGDSDALNTADPGSPECTGVLVDGGAKAYLPAFTANAGIGAAPASTNGRDRKVGVTAVGDWGGSETLQCTTCLSLAFKP
jgi:hypothetical protein